jgi:competence protein ComEC
MALWPRRGLDVTGCWPVIAVGLLLVSTNADSQSCRVAKQLAHAHGHRRLDWIVLLDPVASEAMACWSSIAEHVQAPIRDGCPW